MRTEVTVKHGNTLNMLIDMQGIEGRGAWQQALGQTIKLLLPFWDNETVGHDNEILFHCHRCHFPSHSFVINMF